MEQSSWTTQGIYEGEYSGVLGDDGSPTQYTVNSVGRAVVGLGIRACRVSRDVPR